MTKITKYIVLLILILLLTGCSHQNQKDSYVEGTDCQYQYFSQLGATTNIAKGKDSVYFVIGNFIYQLDQKTGVVAPLCNKVNCLHDKETNHDRMEECNSYLSAGDDETQIVYMDGYIYTIIAEREISKNSMEKNSTLYKIADDGSSKEKIYQWKGAVVMGWCMHRNVLYYVEHTYDKNNQQSFLVRKIDFNSVGKRKPETIFVPDKNITVYCVDTPIAFGNHIYLNVDGLDTKDIDNMSKEELLKHSYLKDFEYNVENETVTEIKGPDKSDPGIYSSITFWNNKLLYCAKDGAKFNLYSADLVGSNAKAILKDVSDKRHFSTDGKKIYISNCAECLEKIYSDPNYFKDMSENHKSNFKFTVKIDIYNKKMKLVDTVQAPFEGFPTEPAYGIGDRMYYLQENKAGDGVNIEYWDKTKIGSYHGKEYSFTPVYEQKYTKEYLEKIGMGQ